MKRIDRYIFRTVLATSLVSLLVLLTLETFFTLLTELEDVGKGQYGVAQMMQYLLLTLPRRAYEIFPLGLLLGGLMGMGGLASGSELVAMRAAGVSRLRLGLSAMQVALLLSLGSLALGEYLAPWTEQTAQEVRAAARAEGVAIRQGKGFWARDGELFVNVRAVLPGARLSDLYVFQMDEAAQLRLVAHADSAYYQDGRWQLHGVKSSALGEERVQMGNAPQLAMASVISPALIGVLAADANDLAIRDLATYIDYLEHNGLNADEYRLAFWLKVLGPLTNLTMLFIALPFVFAPQRSGGAGQRLLIGVLLGLLFYLANRMLSNLVLLYGYPPILGACLPSLLFLGSGAVALRRMRG
ncbi:MAG TPA: LPS export ABC transporter permease LptG [Candidatus Competibacteraceae bacterium]|nr:LPS export ABC transporter permease LptG [Candidatus Competibacteraceae bacterium]